MKIKGHKGKWHSISTTIFNGENVFLMESDLYGDEAACIIVDSKGEIILEDVWNGFDDLEYV